MIRSNSLSAEAPGVRRILIITSGPLCENPRPLKEASALTEAGYEVTVLSVRTRAASEGSDRELLRSVRFRRDTIDMTPGLGEPDARVFRRRLRLWLARKAAARFGLELADTLGPVRPLFARAEAHAADLTIVHTEGPFWVGAQLLRKGRRVAADFEDWHSEDLRPSDRAGRPLKLLRTVEQALLRDAAYCTTTSNVLADALHERYGGHRPDVVSNSFALQPDPHRVEPGAVPSLFWFSQTIGPGRGLEEFVEAFGRTTRPARLVLLGQERGGFAAQLFSRLPAEKRARASIRPLVPPAELPAVIAQHDVGLALERSEILNRDLSITNKILQYLNAGLAVLATATAGQREVFEHAPGAGIFVDFANPAATAAAIDNLIGNTQLRIAMGAAARHAAKTTYCWEQDAMALISTVDQVLRPRS